MNNNRYSEDAYEIVCPYCFKRYSNYNALFVDYRNTAEEVYPEYEEYLKYFLGTEAYGGRKMPLYFRKRANDGIPNVFAAGTETDEVSYVRACPHCCNILPALAGKVKTFSVVVTGSDDAERSFYIASVLHRLNRDMMSGFGASFMPADLKTANMFFEQYEEPLYASGLVPEAAASISPLVYEFNRIGAAAPEEWKGNVVTYNSALLYIYNIDRDLCERYPMIAYNAIAQANGFAVISDLAEAAPSDDPAYDPWLGYLTDTFRRIFGSSPAERPAALIMTKADKVFTDDRKWTAMIKTDAADKAEKLFPTSAYRSRSDKAEAVFRTRIPSHYSAYSALFAKESSMYFTERTLFEPKDDGTAVINDCKVTEASFEWLLSRFSVLPESVTKSFTITM
ncbi:MAG: hypothetical protein II820_11190 [Ruminiclostridium sp.]|nr:hypothetical protein [Ruminiclostridium sp.]